MKAINYLNLIILILNLSSCASVKQKEKRQKKVEYSQETQKSFKEIEREMLLKRYKRMRVEDGILQERPGQDYRPKLRTPPQQVRKRPFTRLRPKQNIKRPHSPPTEIEPVEAPVVKVNPQIQRREIEQNLTYFCMNMRKDPRFSTEQTCEEYTQSIQNKCLEKFSEGELALTRCVKSQL
jgi:hypothetical protein